MPSAASPTRSSPRRGRSALDAEFQLGSRIYARASSLGLPIHQGDEVVGMIGLANRPNGYDEDVIGYLKPMLLTCGALIDAYRNFQRRQLAENETKRLDLLMDCQMPGMDGFAATMAVRAWEHEHGGHVPIIAMTAQALEGDRERCIAAGMDDYITKPVRFKNLNQVVERWLAANSDGDATPPAPDALGD